MNTQKHHITPFEIPEELTTKIIFHLVEIPAKITSIGALKNLFFSKLPYNAERFIENRFRKKLTLLLENNVFDIVQLEGLYLCTYISTIKKYSKAKVAYRSQNIEHEIWERTLIQTKGIKKIYLKILASRLKKFELNAINKYDLLVPITQRDEKHYIEFGNIKPSITIPAGFNFEDSIELKSEFEMNLFFIGALDWSPNQEGLIWFIDKCWPLIIKERPQTIFKIAGRNAPLWIIEKLKHKNIKYLGEIDDAKSYILQNGIMVVPLLSGSGMRVKIIEGMSYGKAIVTTSIGCEGINIKNTVQLFIADSPDDFSKHALSLLDDREKVRRVGDKAYKFVNEEFNNKNLNSKLVAFYNQHI